MSDDEENPAVEVIELTREEVDAAVRELEAKHPEFRGLLESRECCIGCLIPWDEWSMEKVSDFEGYQTYRWLRGENV